MSLKEILFIVCCFFSIIYSDVPLENLQIQVKDASGNVVQMENVPIGGQQKYSFVLDTDLVGECVVELTCDTKFLYNV